ncbi:MAG TPA: hypothetical protein VF179_20250 [Thermoanaerobaculia bacterium]|nr:hypothetical protein [Thermoanaerobaculia bacterium]
MSNPLQNLTRTFSAAAAPAFTSRRPAAVLTTDEQTPEGFYEDLQARYRPDGYIYGTGMANVLSMVEAFERAPCGLIVADPDPVVAAAGGRIAGALARHPEPEGFLEEIGVPAMAFVLRGYPKLHELAREGRFAFAVASPFDGNLIAAVRALPGFAGSSNLIYLADEVTQILRRSLFASARARLRLNDGEAPEEVRSTADFVAHLNGLLARLGPLVEASRNAVCVYSSEADDLLLRAEPGVPGFSGEGFYFQFDLDKMILGFFETGEGAAGLTREPAWSGWREAPVYRAAALRLFGAAVRGDERDARSALADLALEWARLGRETGLPDYRAYRVAELGEALWMLGRSALAGVMPDEARHLGAEIAGEARRLAGAAEDLLRQAGGRAKDLLLFAQAFRIAGRLAGDSSLGDRGEPFAGAALDLRRDGVFLDQGEPDLRLHTEALLRLVLCDLHRPAHATNDAAAQGLDRLLPAVRQDGGLDLPASGETPGDGYTSYATQDAMVHENARLAFLFHGLTNEDLDASRMALRMHFYPGRRGAAAAFAAMTDRG